MYISAELQSALMGIYSEGLGVDTVEIGGDLELTLSTTPDGIELRKNSSLFNNDAFKRVYHSLWEEWFNGILAGMRDADLVVLTVMSVLFGLSCIEKYPNMKAIGIYVCAYDSTAEFTPPIVATKSQSVFNWINSLEWKLVEYGTSFLYTDKINQLRANVALPPIKVNYNHMVQSLFHKPMVTATIYSKYLLPRPSDWSENHHMVGAILEEENSNFVPSDAILAVLDKWKNEKIIYVGLGSHMSGTFEIDKQLEILNNIQRAIRNNNCVALISLVGLQPTVVDKLSNDDYTVYLQENIPHCWLFPNISAAIHHGGAGTTHISIRYGLPTLVIPNIHDQLSNGDRVFINKLGPRPINMRQVNLKNLTSAIRDLIQNYTMYQINVKKMGELIRQEDGLGNCVRLIETELST
ncbi:unnamed protein product [Adineta ricciae]|uniref:Erythromycin biosynthesis protein CIII-like C-terminal domain-containing protein n=1 Tax=Adineta ricciae TaxID=249248 RepID=A0A815H422_ADIRI|nr:unnamed protein product [Adineta ricciae]CAF1513612.1 unnamed protein product [Adineta ricciae]